VSAETDIRDYLASRRARITPEQAGLTTFGGRRRVAGLRREEVAMLAGISAEYYTQLERGDIRGVSEEVLAAVVRALRLNEAEQIHLADLMRALNAAPVPDHDAAERDVPMTIRSIVDGLSVPALVRNRRLDIVYSNVIGKVFYYAFYSDGLGAPGEPPNPARFVFLDALSHDFFADWDRAADDMVALLRAETGRNPHDQGLKALIDELSARSEAFLTRWDAHEVLFHRVGIAAFRHPVVGELRLSYEDLDLPRDPGLTILVFIAEPGSDSDAALKRLALQIENQ
jgi:transcriptional regulator with XRE-family HTH domain